jgi:hypothetical protein
VWDERYDRDVLADMKHRRAPAARTEMTLERGLVIEHTQSQWCGAVVGISQGHLVQLADFHGVVRSFPISDGFLVDGKPVRLTLPKAKPSRQRTASGSFSSGQTRARVARASRIFVEGVHDAELVEQVWGDDLRAEGVVVELLDGADHLDSVLREFQPDPSRRAGVLLDHLVTGSKETKLADIAKQDLTHPEMVKIVGHPFIDIWQAVKPSRIGLSEWPHIPYGTDWKTGVCQHLGWPCEEYSDIAQAWQRILGRVRDFWDLEPQLIGRVEELIDFVTEGAS